MKSRGLFLALLLGGTGCSWLGMTRPPEPPVEPSPPVACTTSRALPILDTTAAILVGVPSAIFTGWAIATPVNASGCSLLSGPNASPCSLVGPNSSGAKAGMIAGGLVGVGFAVMEAFSAADGFGWAGRCEVLGETQLACLSGVEASCAALRKLPQQPGKAPGERCEASSECREGSVCYIGHCQVGER
jgi:hypothetical protein